MDLVDLMKKVLANNFALYLKAHGFHWNVEGPDFAQYHEFFGNFYEEVYGAVDSIAEHIRALDAYAPNTFERYTELLDIKSEERILQAGQMIQQLSNDNQTMIQSLISAYRAAEESVELGLANFIQDRIDQHKKHAWMLKAFSKA